jgi:hypothetical protein
MCLISKTNIASGPFFVLSLLLRSNYADIKKLNEWDKANIDPNLSKDSIYKKLDNQKKIFFRLEKQDSVTKRTSDFPHFRGEEINIDDTQHSKFNNSRAS